MHALSTAPPTISVSVAEYLRLTTHAVDTVRDGKIDRVAAIEISFGVFRNYEIIIAYQCTNYEKRRVSQTNRASVTAPKHFTAVQRIPQNEPI